MPGDSTTARAYAFAMDGSIVGYALMFGLPGGRIGVYYDHSFGDKRPKTETVSAGDWEAANRWLDERARGTRLGRPLNAEDTVRIDETWRMSFAKKPRKMP